ncbi:BREX system P-loop protein BrxC [Chamaesiphon minutus]|uniref:BREX system P-loop protein BrxC n=1 Tax=Chamaesiphon minutus TaxID=1173032 RepID=UPI00030C100D|nr:BREX system P-loop protein BrxC [Chamaesiphon minutus]
MQIKDVFANDVTRDIAPVIYFHEQDPAKVAAEVSEYIVTGGYPENDPRSKIGIHEQFVKLLSSLAEELQKTGGVELPASWISGFYGSGKSSFAKLLGLALDGLILPDGQEIAEVFLKRDESPKSNEFRAAWTKVRSLVQPIAVIFDIGAVARDDEQIHAAVKREIQKRLGYCSTSNYVADYELNLELEGLWPEFEASAQRLLGRAWAEAKDSRMAEEEFSQVMHAMNPSRYTDPLSWFESRAGANTGEGSSVDETIKAISEMLRLRAAGKTLFVVVDEVSQYIYQNNTRMLKLQSFVSALGQKLKGQVWLLATGQQKLEDSDDESSIGKLKDRFPPKLRVHLAPTNIRDVVHKRLLKKLPTQEGALREIFQQYRSDLKLYGYQCQTISEEDFVEVYPMLPGYVDLLMQITSNLRLRSSRAKGDDHAIRGLLQLLGDLFRERKLGARPLGNLITLEDIFEVQQSSLDNDMQTTLTRIFGQDEVLQDALLARVAKIVSLLELIQEQEPTTVALVSQCLYERLGQGNQEGRISQALEQLRELNLLSYSEKTGYKLQSSAGQEWARERDSYSIIHLSSMRHSLIELRCDNMFSLIANFM